MPSAFHLCLLVILALNARLHRVASVKCVGDSDCVKTDFTLPKCKGGVCVCKAPYKPIKSGCGKKLDKPTLKFEDRPIDFNLAYEGTANVALKCLPSNIAAWRMNNIQTIWKFGDQRLEEWSDTLKINISTKTAASPYRCALTSKETLDGALTSEFSDPFQISMVTDKTLAGGDWKPKLIVPKKSEPMVFLPLSCTNLPLGQESRVNIEFYSNASSSAVEQNYLFKKDVELYCKVTLKSDEKKSIESDRVTVSLADNIDGVTISIVGYSPDTTSLTAKTGQSQVALKCENNGKVAVNPIVLGFAWKADSEYIPMLMERNPYVVNTTVPGTVTYSCEGEFGSQPARESTGISITVENEPVPVPIIEISPTEITPESHISLECGKQYTGGKVTYMWIKNRLPIIGQYDRVIQYHNIGLVIDKYYCAAVKDGYTVPSQITSIGVKPNKPTLTVTNSPKAYSEGATYTLNCSTSPTSEAVVHHFTRDGTTLNGSSPTYTLENVSQADNGTYTCKVQLGDVSSDVSNSVKISVGASGKYCDNEDDCKGKGYSGVCTDNRCVCHSGYKPEGDHCHSSATLVEISILGLAFALLISMRLF